MICWQVVKRGDSDGVAKRVTLGTSEKESRSRWMMSVHASPLAFLHQEEDGSMRRQVDMERPGDHAEEEGKSAHDTQTHRSSTESHSGNMHRSCAESMPSQRSVEGGCSDIGGTSYKGCLLRSCDTGDGRSHETHPSFSYTAEDSSSFLSSEGGEGDAAPVPDAKRMVSVLTMEVLRKLLLGVLTRETGAEGEFKRALETIMLVCKCEFLPTKNAPSRLILRRSVRLL